MRKATALKPEASPFAAAVDALAAHDARLAEAVNTLEGLRARIGSGAKLRADLRAKLDAAADAGDVTTAEQCAREIAKFDNADGVATRTAAAFGATVQRMTDEAARLERLAQDEFEAVFGAQAEALLFEIRRDLVPRLAVAWSAAVHAGGELALRQWLQVALGEDMAALGLLPASQVVEGMPDGKPRSRHLAAAQAALQAGA